MTDNHGSTIQRWFVVFEMPDGTKSLAFSAQSRHAFATKEDAEDFVRLVRESNSEARLVSVFGPKGGAGLSAMEVECCPSGDPMRTIF